MACLTLDLIISRATGLKNVNHVSNMEVDVAGSLEGNRSCPQTFKSPVDVRGRCDPKWSFKVGKLYVDETSAHEGSLKIHFELFSRRRIPFLSENYIGEVAVPVKELFDKGAAAYGVAREMSKDVRLKSGQPEGKLVFSYKFVDRLIPEVAAPGHSVAPNADVACLTLDLIVIGATDLKDVNYTSKMEVAVAGSLEGNPSCPQNFKSPADVGGHCNPKWSFNVGKLYVDGRSAQEGRVNIRFKLFSLRRFPIRGENYIGEVVVPVKELLDEATATYGVAREMSKDVLLKSGQPGGKLDFSYTIVRLIAGVADPGHSVAPNADVDHGKAESPPPVHPNQQAPQAANLDKIGLGLQAADVALSTGFSLYEAIADGN